ncbi:hypothetical protein HK098_008122, partial [Nowakowskiella sp. JEL0407]
TPIDILQPEQISKDFDNFIHCLAWPINLNEHPGYKSTLAHQEKFFIQTAPYFANRNVEVIFNCPCYFNILQNSTKMDVSDLSKERSDMHLEEGSNSIANENSIIDIWHEIMLNDLVGVIWIEDLRQMAKVAVSLRLKNILFFLYIHPLPKTPGLYLIKISASSVLNLEDCLVFGPLCDGMVVSSHSLAFLVRKTVISAQMICRMQKGGYRKPIISRRNQIEEICNKYKTGTSIAM